jgi:hypothetical protein
MLANKTNADQIAAGLTAEIMLRGLAVPQVTPPLNVLLATRSCPTLATTTLPTSNVA